MTVEEGDIVHWEWTPLEVEGVGYRLYETKGLGNNEPKEGGFRNLEEEQARGEDKRKAVELRESRLFPDNN